MFVKICGLQTTADVAAAVASGADAIGFVFAESVRRVTPEQAAELCAGVSNDIIRVAVMLHPTPREWKDVQTVFKPDWLQTDLQDFDGLDIGTDTVPLPVLRDHESIDSSLLQAHNRLLFEGKRSGQGATADWGLAAAAAAQTSIVLAGGLDADNVAQAIKNVMPWGVDVSSGVEDAPGRKSAAKIAAFIKAAREAENRTDGKN
ncbi:MAG: phosphoribosylanthranilate isomerase [Gammaproteobacteria bacterium]